MTVNDLTVLLFFSPFSLLFYQKSRCPFVLLESLETCNIFHLFRFDRWNCFLRLKSSDTVSYFHIRCFYSAKDLSPGTSKYIYLADNDRNSVGVVSECKYKRYEVVEKGNSGVCAFIIIFINKWRYSGHDVAM